MAIIDCNKENDKFILLLLYRALYLTRFYVYMSFLYVCSLSKDYATHKDNIYYLFICRLSASQEENPLEFEDIVNKKTYDKMRPPKPDGMLLFHLYYNLNHKFYSIV